MQKIRFLLVDHDTAAATIAQTALESCWSDRGIEIEVIYRPNAFEALQYLQTVTDLPSLVITDIKLPNLDGNRLIGLLKSSSLFRLIPILVLSSSDDPGDRLRAYLGGCAGYFVKTGDYGKFVRDLQTITDYWVLSRLPDRHA